MGNLENFLHDKPQKTPTLIKAALSHVQFETIHPFLDGNGRLGRLLIPLLFCVEGLLPEPILYISLYLKANRQNYYDWLQTVRTEGDWEGWLSFFFNGVIKTSNQAVDTAKRLAAMYENDRDNIKRLLGRSARSALMVHHEMQKDPIISIPAAAKKTALSTPTVSAAMKRLVGIGIARQVDLKGKKRAFSYIKYLQTLAEGTEPIR